SFTVGTSTTVYAAGLYSVLARGGDTPHLIVDAQQVADMVGTTTDHVSLSSSGSEGGYLAMGVSDDANRIVFSANYNGDFLGDSLLAVNRDDPATSLHTIGPLPAAGVGVCMAGISGDGSKIFRYDEGNAVPVPRLTVYDFDGHVPLTLNVPAGYFAITA